MRFRICKRVEVRCKRRSARGAEEEVKIFESGEADTPEIDPNPI
jgi:hypothetical protein